MLNGFLFKCVNSMDISSTIWNKKPISPGESPGIDCLISIIIIYVIIWLVGWPNILTFILPPGPCYQHVTSLLV